MVKKISEVFAKVKKIQRARHIFYSLTDLKKTLEKHGNEEIELTEIEKINEEIDEGLIISLTYVDEKLYDLYDFELRVFIVSKPNLTDYLLASTGKESVDEISPYYKEKLSNCYREIIKPSKSIPAKSLINYIDYVQSSQELKERMEEVFGSYDKDKIFFEYY